MRQPRIEKLNASPRGQLALNLETETEVEPHLKERVEQLEKEGMPRAAARRFAEQEEDQKDAAHTPPNFSH